MMNRVVDRPVILHKGTYKPAATTAEAVFMITGMTIGAGILGIPYVVSRVGIVVGLSYIFVLGLVMLFLNLMIGEIAARTGDNLQLPGLVGKYLGPAAKELLTVIFVLSGVGSLLAYIIGEGAALAAMFGGSALGWSVIFWSIGSALIFAGLERVKAADKIISLLVIIIISVLSVFLLPHVKLTNIAYTNFGAFFLPYGVILFALNGTGAIAEAHALMPNEPLRFKKALIIGAIIPIIVYALFAFAVVGAQGLLTTEVASVGLGIQYGRVILFVANLFAVLAMSTGFIGLGTALKEILVWDHGMSVLPAKFLVISVPLALFLSGFNNFVGILGFVGGLFIGLEMVVMVLVYWKARHT